MILSNVRVTCNLKSYHEKNNISSLFIFPELCGCQILDFSRGKTVCLQLAYPCWCYRQWVGCVQALLSIVDRPAIPKDCHLEVLHHGVHHLPAHNRNNAVNANMFEKNGVKRNSNTTENVNVQENRYFHIFRSSI